MILPRFSEVLGVWQVGMRRVGTRWVGMRLGEDSAHVILSPNKETSTEHRNKHRALKQAQRNRVASEEQASIRGTG